MIDLVNPVSPATRDAIQNNLECHALQFLSEVEDKVFVGDLLGVEDARVVFVLLAWDAGAESHPSLAKDNGGKRPLGFLTRSDEIGLVDYPEASIEVEQLHFLKQIFRLLLPHHHAFALKVILYVPKAFC